MVANQKLLDAFVDEYAKLETKPVADMNEDELRKSCKRLEQFLAKMSSGGTGTA